MYILSFYWWLRRNMDWYTIKRRLRFLYQRWTRGWDDSDTWALDTTIAKFALPRLKRFVELNNGTPIGMTEAQWDQRLSDMVYAMEYAADPDVVLYDDSIDFDRVKRGERYFGRYYRDLWW
jgi:hypothetical protein